MTEERTRAKTTIEVELPAGKTLNDFNEAVLLAFGHYVKTSAPSWTSTGFKSIETRLSKGTLK